MNSGPPRKSLSHSFVVGIFSFIAGLFLAGMMAEAFSPPTSGPPNAPAALFYNSTNERIGIATTSPQYKFSVAGTIQTAATTTDVGGIIFPDGTRQTTAYDGGTGAIIQAANVQAGQFGQLVGGGLYAFPEALAISTGTAGLPYVNTNGQNLTVPLFIDVDHPQPFSDWDSPAIRIQSSVAGEAEISLDADETSANWFWTISANHSSNSELRFYNRSNMMLQLQRNNVSIGDTSIEPSAIFQVVSSNKGFLPPKMGTRPSSPASGLIIYNTSSNRLEYYNGSTWISL